MLGTTALQRTEFYLSLLRNQKTKTKQQQKNLIRREEKIDTVRDSFSKPRATKEMNASLYGKISFSSLSNRCSCLCEVSTDLLFSLFLTFHSSLCSYMHGQQPVLGTKGFIILYPPPTPPFLFLRLYSCSLLSTDSIGCMRVLFLEWLCFVLLLLLLLLTLYCWNLVFFCIFTVKSRGKGTNDV